MAIFSMNFNTVCRKPKGNQRIKTTSAVAAVSYAITTSLTDERLGKTFNNIHGNQKKAALTHDLGLFIPGKGHIVQQERDRQGAYSEFWSKVELKEKRSDSRTARTIVVALPVEMDRTEHAAIVEKFQLYLAQTYGMASQAGIHYDHQHNPHAHLVATTRTVNSDGELGEKIRILDSPKSAYFEIKKIGEAWAEINNEILIPKYGTSITHKSFKEQGIDKPKGEHLGPVEWRRMQAELAEIDQQRAELERRANADIQQGNRAERGAAQRTLLHSDSAIYGEYRKPDPQKAPGSLYQGNQGSNRQGSGEMGAEILQTNARKDGTRDQPLADGPHIHEAAGENGKRLARAEKGASGISDQSREHDRANARQTDSNYERPTSKAKRRPRGNQGSANNAGSEIDALGISQKAQLTSSLQKLDNALTLLGDYLELEQVRKPQEKSLYAKLDQALDRMQEKFDRKFLRGEYNGESAAPTEPETQPEPTYRPPFRLLY